MAFDVYAVCCMPFSDYAFMRKALVACVLLSVSAAPVGIFMVMRRMSLTGDAMSHAILPGVAMAYIIFGYSLIAMTIGGMIAGLIVAFGSAFVSRRAKLQEESNLAVLYLLSLAVGVLLLSSSGNNVDLLSVLFGSLLAINVQSLIMLGVIASCSLLILALVYRSLLLECLDPQFFAMVSRLGVVAHYTYLVLVVINLVAGFHALGTLMSVGLMIIPAVAARFWVNSVLAMMAVAISLAIVASYLGLLLSFYYDLAPGPAIILLLAFVYVISFILGSHAGLIRHYRKQQFHLEH